MLKAFKAQAPANPNTTLQEMKNIGIKRKRRLENLFGDIYQVCHLFKKLKTSFCLMWSSHSLFIHTINFKKSLFFTLIQFTNPLIIFVHFLHQNS